MFRKRGISTAPSPAPNPLPLAEQLGQLLVGQKEAIDAIVPFVRMHQAGLSQEGRPIGVVLMLGPTGSGKTRTVEALAEVLHGSSKNLLRVDCGEFAAEHEVSKLIGAPPGYLGHRETQPIFTQAKINAIVGDKSDISLILFDEVEKSAHSVTRLLLSILDKATLRLGDNSTVNFERCLVFLTSNLGAKEIQRSLTPAFGFEMMTPIDTGSRVGRIRTVGVEAVRRRFSPEFVNRIDKVVVFRPLSIDAYSQILEQQLADFRRLVSNRLGVRGFCLTVTDGAKNLLIELGFSVEYGARELKRTIQRNLVVPIAELVADGHIVPMAIVTVDAAGGQFSIKVNP